MAYPTAAALKAASTGDARAALDTYDVDQLAALYTAAIAAVEEFCRQSFAGSAVKTVVLDGNGNDRLPLPERLITLTTLEVLGTALAADDVELSPQGDSLTIVTVPGNYYTRVLASLDPDMDPSRRTFRLGRSTVAVAGTWGWAAPPDAVANALRYDMEDGALADTSALSGTVHAFRKLGLRDIAQGNLRATLLSAGDSLSPRAQKVLIPHVWHSSGVLV